jgi:carboxymethylenebutenolidase
MGHAESGETIMHSNLCHLLRATCFVVWCTALSGAAPTDTGSAHAETTGLPAAEDSAKAALERSPRHGEFMDVERQGAPSLRTWVVYPERKDKAGVVLVIHEVYGLSDWIRAVADQLASEGFIAVAPDLLSGLGPGGGGTDAVQSRDDVVQLVRALSADETKARLDAVHDWAARLPAANGRVASLQPKLQAAVVYYGSSPDSLTLTQVHAPVLGLYGGDDARVDATIPPAQAILATLGRSFEPHVFEGAGHGFLRAQTLRDGANMKASRAAWPRTIEFLRLHLEAEADKSHPQGDKPRPKAAKPRPEGGESSSKGGKSRD